MSDILLQLRNIRSLHSRPSQTAGNPFGNHNVPLRTLRVHQQFLGLRKLFNWSRCEHEKLSKFIAKRFDVLNSINKKHFSLLLSNLKRLRGNILSVIWPEMARHTNLMCKCKFHSLNKKSWIYGGTPSRMPSHKLLFHYFDVVLS